jgi:Rrf2 family protein
MADILKISDATALALHTMVHLAIDPNTQATTAEIAELFEVSKHHLAKVHQRLTKADLLRSYRGPAGGVGLAKDPAEITLLEIYEVMEGSMLCKPCLFGKDKCPRTDCVLGALLPDLALQVRDYFATTTLEKLAKDSTWRTAEE